MTSVPLGTRGRTVSVLARRAAAVFLVLHGIAHGVGAQAAVTAAGEGESVAYLWDRVDLASAGALYVVAAAWVVVAVAFVAAAVALWRNRSRWPALLGVVAAASLALSVFAMPMAVAGVVINVVLLAAVALRSRNAQQ